MSEHTCQFCEAPRYCSLPIQVCEGCRKAVWRQTGQGPLIAAAPQMLEALRRAKAHFEVLGHDAVCNGVHAPDGQCEGEHWAAQTINQIDAAIAAATGGAS